MKSTKACKISNYTERHLLISASTVTGCVSISSFTFLVGIPLGIASSAITLKISIITVGIKNIRKKRKLVIMKKKKERSKIVFLAKTMLNTLEGLVSNALIDSGISHDELVSVNVLKKYDDMKEEIKNANGK